MSNPTTTKSYIMYFLVFYYLAGERVVSRSVPSSRCGAALAGEKRFKETLQISKRNFIMVVCRWTQENGRERGRGQIACLVKELL